METIRLFAFFCEGNELVGKDCVNFLKEMLTEWKKDSRHLWWLHLVILQWKEVIFFDFYGARPQRWAGRSERTF